MQKKDTNPLDVIYETIFPKKRRALPLTVYPSLAVQVSSYHIPGVQRNTLTANSVTFSPGSVGASCYRVTERLFPFARTWNVEQAKDQLPGIISTDIFFHNKKMEGVKDRWLYNFYDEMDDDEWHRMPKEELMLPYLLEFLFDPIVSDEDRKSEEKLIQILNFIFETGGKVRRIPNFRYSSVTTFQCFFEITFFPGIYLNFQPYFLRAFFPEDDSVVF